MSPLAGLVVLLGDAADHRLAVAGIAGALRSVTGIGPVRWASMDRRGQVLITMPDGSLRLAARISVAASGSPSSVAERLATLAAGRAVASASISPDGARAAAIVGQPLTGEQFEVLVLPIPGGAGQRARAVRIDGQAEGVAPVWLDGDRVAIWRRDRADELAAAVVDARSARVIETPAGPPIGAVSADGRVGAVPRPHEGSVWLGDVRAWEQGLTAAASIVLADPFSVPYNVLLNHDGSRLALIAGNAESTSLEGFVHDSGGWHRVESLTADPTGPDSLVAPIGWLPGSDP